MLTTIPASPRRTLPPAKSPNCEGLYPKAIFCVAILFFISAQMEQLTIYNKHISSNETISNILLNNGAAISGVLLGSQLAIMRGRVKIFQMANIAFLATCFGQFFYSRQSSFIIIFLGVMTNLGTGLLCSVFHHYVAEVAPTAYRTFAAGKLFAACHLGFIWVALLSLIFGDTSSGTYILSFIAPTLFMMLVTSYLPESPRWLASKNLNNDAKIMHCKLMKNFEEERFPFAEVKPVSKFTIHLIGTTLSNLALGFASTVVVKYRHLSPDFVNIPEVEIIITRTMSAVFSFLFAAVVGHAFSHRKIVVFSLSCNIIVLWVAAVVITFLENNELFVLLLGLTFHICRAFYDPVVFLKFGTLYPMREKTIQAGIPWVAYFISQALVKIVLTAINNVYIEIGICTLISLSAISNVLWVIPETKGKTLEEIHNNLEEAFPWWLRKIWKRFQIVVENSPAAQTSENPPQLQAALKNSHTSIGNIDKQKSLRNVIPQEDVPTLRTSPVA